MDTGSAIVVSLVVGNSRRDSFCFPKSFDSKKSKRTSELKYARSAINQVWSSASQEIQDPKKLRRAPTATTRSPPHACSAKFFAVNFSGLPTIKYLCGITISNQEILKARAVHLDPRISERMNSVIGSKTVVMLILLISVHR